jgi:hypothetical protein
MVSYYEHKMRPYVQLPYTRNNFWDHARIVHRNCSVTKFCSCITTKPEKDHYQGAQHKDLEIVVENRRDYEEKVH